MLRPASWASFRLSEPKAVITPIAMIKSTNSTQTMNDWRPEDFSYHLAKNMAATEPADAQKLSQNPYGMSNYPKTR